MMSLNLGHSGMCGRNGSSTIVNRRLLMLFNKGIIECLDNNMEEGNSWGGRGEILMKRQDHVMGLVCLMGLHFLAASTSLVSCTSLLPMRIEASCYGL
jgi:hypothetical protein